MTHNNLKTISMKLLAIGVVGIFIFQAGASFSFAKENPAAGVSHAKSFAAKQQLPAIQFTTKKINTDTKMYTAAIEYPVVQGLQSAQYQGELNHRIAETARADLETVQQQAERDASAAEAAGDDFIPYDITVKYEVQSDGSTRDNGYLSIKVLTYVFTGGAHGITRADTYNIHNAPKPSLITLKDLFGANYKTVINKKVKEVIAANPEDYFQDTFKGISDDQTFYLQGNHAVILFQNYEIAPYSSGLPEIQIPLANTETGDSSALVVKINGSVLDIGQAPLYTNKDGMTMAPLRSISTALGYKLIWNETLRQAELTKGSQRITVTKGKVSYPTNKQSTISLDTEPVVKNGSLYVPLAFFSKVFQAKVVYTSDSLTISN
ncbi:stalk domain-containing protein [Paenibacillus nasutitermitis]|uniref:Copper amine oxidase N-terminal domain-containing protein n=1 Tax=Paenibacillus nasutitermitis TaxID=1652958 RepID=A0A917DWD4_9BACL|nr:stalk domain-containing protein [Paenibacillus nasutitermitis]GGD76561.1 hypothetical protein GCM10010911_38300 [Paenibacillus nasutitermitis]